MITIGLSSLEMGAYLHALALAWDAGGFTDGERTRIPQMLRASVRELAAQGRTDRDELALLAVAAVREAFQRSDSAARVLGGFWRMDEADGTTSAAPATATPV